MLNWGEGNNLRFKILRGSKNWGFKRSRFHPISKPKGNNVHVAIHINVINTFPDYLSIACVVAGCNCLVKDVARSYNCYCKPATCYQSQLKNIYIHWYTAALTRAKLIHFVTHEHHFKYSQTTTCEHLRGHPYVTGSLFSPSKTRIPVISFSIIIWYYLHNMNIQVCAFGVC